MIFDRYLAREFFKIFSALMTLFLSFFCIIDFLEKNARYFTRYRVPTGTIIEYYLVQLPKVFQDALPFVVMFASIITLWVFAKNGEIAAARAAGRSLFRSAAPLLVTGFSLSIVSFVVGEFLVPVTQMRLRYIESVSIKHDAYDPMFLESKWVRGSSGILHFARFDPMERVIYRPQYYVFSSFSSVKIFAYANRAVFNGVSHHWFLENAVVSQFDPRGKVLRTELVPSLETSVSSEPPRILREGITSDQLSFRELADLIALSRKGGGNLASREVDLYQKLSLPFANFLFTFLALPFALRKERRADTYISIVFSLAAAVVYWVGNASMRSLAQNAVIQPAIAAWVVNVIFLIVAFFVVLKLDRGE